MSRLAHTDFILFETEDAIMISSRDNKYEVYSHIKIGLNIIGGVTYPYMDLSSYVNAQ